MAKKMIVLLISLLLAVSCGCTNGGNGEVPNSETLPTASAITLTTETPNASPAGTLPVPTVTDTEDVLPISPEEQVFVGGETIENVINYFGEMTKEEILQKYGEDYEMIEDEETGTTTYQYKERGLTFIFENGLNQLIRIIPNLDIFVLRGFKKGMTMDDVIRLFGKCMNGIEIVKSYYCEEFSLNFYNLYAGEDGVVSFIDLCLEIK